MPIASELSFSHERTWTKLFGGHSNTTWKQKFQVPFISDILRGRWMPLWLQVRPLRLPTQEELQKINHSLVRRLPLQQKERISAVLDCSQRQSLCYPNVWKNSLVSVLALLCRCFQSPSEALWELEDLNLVKFFHISSTTQSTWTHTFTSSCKSNSTNATCTIFFRLVKPKKNQNQECLK